MTYTPAVERLLKVKMYSISTPSSDSGYSVGSIFQYVPASTQEYDNSNGRYGNTFYYDGNLTGLSLTTHTNSNDTIILPSGRYYIQSTVPVPRKSSNTAYFEWQIHSSSSLNGTYSAFGTKGRNNPGERPNDGGDDEGVHKYSAGILESNSDSYLQTKVISNSGFTGLNISIYPIRHIIIWRAD